MLLVCEVEHSENDGIAFSINGNEHYKLPILGIHNMKNALSLLLLVMN